jgi:3-oxoadipate enol-lactonase
MWSVTCMSEPAAGRTFAISRPFGTLRGEIAGTGLAIVFAHGLGGNHLSWWQQVAHFARRHTCITFAHRGFAPSDPVEGGPDPADYVGDLAAVIEHFKLGEVRLVGQSMGGWSTLAYALATPGKVRALVLACTTGAVDFRKAEHPALAGLADWEQRSEAAVKEGMARGVHPACGARMAAEQPALHALYAQMDRLSLGLDKTALRQRLFEARDQPPSVLAGLDVPVLFITGEEDIVIPTCGVQAVAAAAKRGRCEVVPAAGHSVYFERPARFNALVEAFFAEAGGA